MPRETPAGPSPATAKTSTGSTPASSTAGASPAIEQALEALYLLGMAYRKLMTSSIPKDSQHNLGKQFSPLSLGIIFQLNHSGSQSPSQLADHLAIARPNLTPMLADLKRQGMIELQQDPVDKRKQRVTLSRKGETVIVEMRSQHQARFREVLSQLDNKDLDTLGSAARTLGDILARFF